MGLHVKNPVYHNIKVQIQKFFNGSTKGLKKGIL